MTTEMMFYELLKEAIDMYDSGKIDESHPILAPGIDEIREALKIFEQNVLKNKIEK